MGALFSIFEKSPDYFLKRLNQFPIPPPTMRAPSSFLARTWSIDALFATVKIWKISHGLMADRWIKKVWDTME